MLSHTSPHTRARRSMAVAVALGACIVLSGGIASADPIIPDANATATLSIHKYLGSAGAAGNGTVQTVNKPALEGVTFNTFRIFYDAAFAQKVDLTTNQGWTDAASIRGYVPTAADITAGRFTIGAKTYYFNTTPSATGKTNATGTLNLSGLPLGLYLTVEAVKPTDSITVRNLDNTSTVIKGSQVSGVIPFFTTLPMTDPNGPDNSPGTADDNTGWMYTVNVYPKNSVDAITKTVTDKGVVTTSDTQATGGQITAAAPRAVDYTLTSTIPSTAASEIGTYVVYDKLDARVQATALSVKAGTTALAVNTDYVIYVNGAQNNAFTSVPLGAGIQVVMTAAGITKMKTAQSTDPTAKITTVISATVATAGNGDVTNTAALMPSNSWWQTATGTTGAYNPSTDTPFSDGGTPVNPPTSPQVDSLFGDIIITKTNADGGTLLAGAVFSVFADANPADGCTAADVAGTALITGLTTDNAGKATFKGLQANNFYNGAYQTATTGYCVVETKAPAGYNLQATPIPATITATGSLGAYTITAASLTVKNELSNLGNNLPLTGGQGAATVAGFSLLALAGAGGYLMLRRRQDKRDRALEEGLNL